MSTHYTEAQLQSARSADLAEYFRQNGYQCEQRGNEIHVRSFGGLYINTEKNSWHSFLDNKGGYNAIECLTEILGKDFKTAVEELTGINSYQNSALGFQNHSKSEANPKPKTVFKKPEHSEGKPSKVFAFLIQTRKIDKDLISEMFSSRLLYQDKNGNAVFPHYDADGKMVGAELQGTYTKNKSETGANERFQGVATGTRDTVFRLDVGAPEKAEAASKIYVFESAIDLLSFYQMAVQNKLQNCALVSMGGLKKGALKQFQDKGLRIISCVDNDDKGRKFNAIVGLKDCSILSKENVKDWNELLQKRHAILQQTDKKQDKKTKR